MKHSDAAARLDAIKKWFPDCVRATAHSTIIDWPAIQQYFFEHGVSSVETYGLQWAGKHAADMEANSDPAGVLLEDMHGADHTTDNLFISGDNLDALKHLKRQYANQIKVIYIDPPYNTGYRKFVYSDKFDDSLMTYLKRSGQSVFNADMKTPQEIAGRYHVKWLSMMWPRLKLAMDMLTEDGFLFMSIGDRELDNSMRILKEIFGEDNFVKLFLWKKKRKPGYLSPKVGSMYEYVLCVAKNIRLAQPFCIGHTELNKRHPMNSIMGYFLVYTFPPNSVTFDFIALH